MLTRTGRRKQVRLPFRVAIVAVKPRADGVLVIVAQSPAQPSDWLLGLRLIVAFDLADPGRVKIVNLGESANTRIQQGSLDHPMSVIKEATGKLVVKYEIVGAKCACLKFIGSRVELVNQFSRRRLISVEQKHPVVARAAVL